MGRISTILIIHLCFLFTPDKIIAQSFDWAVRAGSYAYDYGRGICTDGSNNVYVTGEFENTGYFNGITMYSRGNHDIFVSKYNAYGGIQWVRRAGGYSGDVGHAISADVNGNVYVTGEFQSTADFGHITLYGGYLNDIFVAKYDKYGNIQWAKKAGGNESDKGLGVADKYGNVYVTGFFQGSATFGSTTLYSSGEKDIFLAKYNTYGTLLWVKKFGSSKKDEGRSVAVDPWGNVIVAGYFQGTIGFGSTYLTCSGDHDGFITKFDGNGNVIWAKKVSGPYYEVTRGVSVDNYGNVYATGVFCYGARFENIPLNPYGQGDVFILSYSSSGAFRWVKRAGGAYYDEGVGIKAEGNGTVYLTGRFSGNAYFGATALYGADGEEVFTTALSTNGSFLWALKAGGSADPYYSYGEPESGLAITIDGLRNVYTTGAYRSNISFGGRWLNPYYNTDIFISKIRQYSYSSRMEASIMIKEERTDDILLSTEAHDGFSYQWFRNNELIQGATDTELAVNEKGYYSTMVIHDADTAISKLMLIDPLEIRNRKNETPKNNLHPNPSSGFISLGLPESSSMEIQLVEIYNMTGQIVQKLSLTPDLNSIQMTIDPDVPDGVYIIKSSSASGEVFGRLVLKRN